MVSVTFGRAWFTHKLYCSRECNKGLACCVAQPGSNTQACPFLDMTAGCKVYNARPVLCALFPLGVNKTAAGFSVIVRELRTCGMHKPDGKMVFHKNPTGGFDHPKGRPLYLELEGSIKSLFGTRAYAAVVNGIESGDVVVPASGRFMNKMVEMDTEARVLAKAIKAGTTPVPEGVDPASPHVYSRWVIGPTPGTICSPDGSVFGFDDQDADGEFF